MTTGMCTNPFVQREGGHVSQIETDTDHWNFSDIVISDFARLKHLRAIQRGAECRTPASRAWKQRRQGELLHNSWSVALASATRSSLGIFCKSAETCMKLHGAWAGCPTGAPGVRHACVHGQVVSAPAQICNGHCCMSPVPFCYVAQEARILPLSVSSLGSGVCHPCEVECA